MESVESLSRSDQGLAAAFLHACALKETIRQRTLAMVHMGDDAEVAYPLDREVR